MKRINVTTAALLIALCIIVGGNKHVSAQTNSEPTLQELMQMIAALTQVLNQLQAQVAAQAGTGSVTNNSASVFPDVVSFGLTNNSISRLQSILATDPAIYPEANVTGYFGTLTQAALSRLQSTFGLAANGTFDQRTRYVFETLLVRMPYTNQADYLRRSDVRSTIQNLVGESTLADLVVGGRVVLSPDPAISTTVPSSDVATMQRILRSDPSIYPTGVVNGVADLDTRIAVTRLRARYSMPYVQGSSPATVSDIINNQTVALFRNLLVINNSATIKNNLLLTPEAAPRPENTPLINQAIRRVYVVVDYVKKQTEVSVTYDSGTNERFILNMTGPNTSIDSAIASRLGRPLNTFSSTIIRREINAKALERIVLSVTLFNDMDLDITYADGTREAFAVTPENIDEFVQFTYRGDYEAYRRDFNMYVDKARRGERVDGVYEYVARIVRRTKAEVERVLIFNVEQYPEDPCANGGCGG